MIRLGVDFGGTKIEVAALDEDGALIARVRKPNPGSYESAIRLVCDLVSQAEQQAGLTSKLRVGLGMPGSLSPKTGRVRNANTTWLNERPFEEDLRLALGRELRVANDANCFALSEAVDGAGAGAKSVFGVIIGTGCGGGVVIDGQLQNGVNGVAGEMGHIPLPWPTAAERGSRHCWCGRTDCLETYISGTAFSADYAAASGTKLGGAEVMEVVRKGDPVAVGVFERYLDRLARGLALIVDLIDPEVIVFGGGMSNVGELYERVPPILEKWVFSDVLATKLSQAEHGDSSGVRGAAWLWPRQP